MIKKELVLIHWLDRLTGNPLLLEITDRTHHVRAYQLILFRLAKTLKYVHFLKLLFI
jgi:hypothetical protein